MTPQDFDYLRKLLKERSGLVLSAEKQYLAESRLLPVARRHSLGRPYRTGRQPQERSLRRRSASKWSRP